MVKLGRGELEARVMDTLWESDVPMTPRDLHDVLRRRGQGVAYTTVMTILVRLWQKGMLNREEDGRAYAYTPVATRVEWTAQRMHEVLSGAGDRDAALTHFARSINTREAAQLRRALDRRRRA